MDENGPKSKHNLLLLIKNYSEQIKQIFLNMKMLFCIEKEPMGFELRVTDRKSESANIIGVFILKGDNLIIKKNTEQHQTDPLMEAAAQLPFPSLAWRRVVHAPSDGPAAGRAHGGLSAVLILNLPNIKLTWPPVSAV